MKIKGQDINICAEENLKV